MYKRTLFDWKSKKVFEFNSLIETKTISHQCSKNICASKNLYFSLCTLSIVHLNDSDCSKDETSLGLGSEARAKEWVKTETGQGPKTFTS